MSYYMEQLEGAECRAECLKHDAEMVALAQAMAPSLEPAKLRRFHLYIGTKAVARFDGEVMAESWDRALEQHEALMQDGDRVECELVREA